MIENVSVGQTVLMSFIELPIRSRICIITVCCAQPPPSAHVPYSCVTLHETVWRSGSVCRRALQVLMWMDAVLFGHDYVITVKDNVLSAFVLVDVGVMRSF